MINTVTAHRGFTLIELSIVLVIIGLIVGGVLVGRDLVRQSEALATMTDIQKYQTAVTTFQGKYGCLAGDCANASALLGQASNCSVSDFTPITSGTCMGTYQSASGIAGDGNIDFEAAGGASVAENFTFWQQLAVAAMIKGSYSGKKANGYWDSTVAGQNTPATPISNGCVHALYSSQNNISMGINGVNLWSWLYPPSSPGNYFSVGTGNYSGDGSGYPCIGPLFTTLQAKMMDTKFDDGQPSTGKIITPMIYGSAWYQQCWSNNVTTNAPEYKVPNFNYTNGGVTAPDSLACSFFIKLDY